MKICWDNPYMVKNQVKILVHVSAGVSVSPTGQVSGKFAVWDLCENLVRNLKDSIKSGI